MSAAAISIIFILLSLVGFVVAGFINGWFDELLAGFEDDDDDDDEPLVEEDRDEEIEVDIDNEMADMTCANSPPCEEGQYQDTNSYGQQCCYTNIEIQPGMSADEIAAMVIGGTVSMLDGVIISRLIDGFKRVSGKPKIKQFIKAGKLKNLASKVRLKLGNIKTLFKTRSLAKMTVSGGKNLAKAAFPAAKLALKAGAKGAIAAFKVSNPVGWVLLAFDVFSIILDATNAGNYNEIKMSKAYKEMKDAIDEQWREILTNEGMDPNTPIISGPLDELEDGKYEQAFNNHAEVYISEQIDIIMNDYLNGVYSDEEFENIIENGLDSWWQHLEGAEFNNQVLQELCDENGGMVVNQDGNYMCSYATKEACDSSYNWWPPNDDDTFVEWRDGKCVMSNQTMREICEGRVDGETSFGVDGITYDYEKGYCVSNQEYCEENGGDWIYNSELGHHDCKIPVGQQIAEFIFGTTITRGVKEMGSNVVDNITNTATNIVNKIQNADWKEVGQDTGDVIGTLTGGIIGNAGSAGQGDSCNVNENCAGFNHLGNPELICHDYKCMSPRNINQSCDEDIDCAGANPAEIIAWDALNATTPGQTYSGPRCAWANIDGDGGWSNKKKICANKSGFALTKLSFVAKELPNGAYCDGNDWCASGNCGSDNRCQAKRSSGTDCSSDSQCQSGNCAMYDPSGNKGSTVTGWTRKCCPQGKGYSAGLVAVACDEGLPEGASCRNNNWCSGNLQCINWRCKPALGEGDECSNDGQCSTGKCGKADFGTGRDYKNRCCPPGASKTWDGYCKKMPNNASCEYNDWCNSGSCYAYKCTNKLSTESNCNNDDQCASGKCARIGTAHNQDWVKKCCPSGKKLHLVHHYCNNQPEGHRCVGDDFCAGNNICVKGSRNNKVCQPKGNDGDHCDNNDDCNGSLKCCNKKCRQKRKKKVWGIDPCVCPDDCDGKCYKNC